MLKAGTTHRKVRAPAFGDVVTARIKDMPADAFAPRGREAHFLGCVDHVTHGVLIGTFNGDTSDLEVVADFTIHGIVDEDYEHQEEQNQADLDKAPNDDEELKDDAFESAGPTTPHDHT